MSAKELLDLSDRAAIRELALIRAQRMLRSLCWRMRPAAESRFAHLVAAASARMQSSTRVRLELPSAWPVEMGRLLLEWLNSIRFHECESHTIIVYCRLCDAVPSRW